MKKNKTHIDWTLIFLFFLLISIGWINIYSTTVESFDSFNFNTSYGRQLIWISSAILLAIFTFVINYRFFPGFATPIYFIFILLLLLDSLLASQQKALPLGSDLEALEFNLPNLQICHLFVVSTIYS